MKITYESEQVQPLFYVRREIQREYARWFHDYEFAHFFTLTFRADVAVIQAEKMLDHFAQRLCTRAFGSAWKTGSDPTKRISFVAALERQSSSRLHWHVAMQPLNHSYRLTTEPAVEKAIYESWLKCLGSGRQFDAQVINKNKDRVMEYLLKEVRYDTDTVYIDWFSCQKPFKPNG